ncbi:MAG: nucleotidyltransferase domain-containing protein [Nitrospinae bacterium]|nr:nucleotidyltransferase domain-containing protein [Nitrospinota bacterium]
MPSNGPHKIPEYRFELDFRPVAMVPDDPRGRGGYFTAFKELLRGERQKIMAWHRAGAGGREVIQAHTGLIDETVKRVVFSLVSLKEYAECRPLDEFSLVAVGGYGRGELNPCSDIDLLFLLKDRVKPATDRFIQDALSILWGIGLEIGHSCRTVKDCMKLAKDDITVKTSMIGTRYLAGDRGLAENLVYNINANVLKRRVNEFLNSKLKEKYARHGLKEGVVCHPEPDIKNGPGGLRDYHVALWAVAVRFGCLSFRDLRREDVISDKELDILDLSVDFSLRVRNELHYLTQKKCDVLSLDIQSGLADNLKYREENGSKPVERFMRDYFLHATNIYNFSETIFERCRQAPKSFRGAILSMRKKDLGNGFYALNSLLSAKENAGALFRKNPMSILELFGLCQDPDMDLDSQLKRQVRLHLDLIDEEFLRDRRAREFLFNLLDHPRSEHVLRLMHEAGALGRILPEFGQNRCAVYYDFYHRYTSDEHSLRMVRSLEDLSGNAEGGLEELSRLYAETPGKRWLKLAALLHFMRKEGERRAESDGEALAAPPLFPTSPEDEEELRKTRESLLPLSRRLELDEEREETLHFLVHNLDEMAETAFHQDIHQPSVVEAFARKMRSPERLRLLYLISYAELRAVAPDTWTAWKKNLLSEFYRRCLNCLQRPESVKDQPRNTREEIHRLLEEEVPAEEIEDHIALLPEDYLVTAYAEEAALHVRMVRALKSPESSGGRPSPPDFSRGASFVLKRSYNDSGKFHNLVLCCHARSEAFKKMTATLTARNMNILGAQIYLRRDDIAIVTIQAEGVRHADPGDPAFWVELENTLDDVLEKRKDLPALFKSRARYLTAKERHLPIVPKIQIDNPPASAYTVIRVEARDHLGMLYKIAKVLADLDVQIHRAKISCRGGRGIDVFYATQRGQKIVFDRLIRRIKENMISVLLIENMEDIG